MMKSTHWSQHWHYISASHRLLLIALIGVASFFMLWSTPSILVRLAISWIIASGLYVLSTFLMMYFSNKENIAHLAEKEDDGAIFILLIILLGSITSLVVIVIIMTDMKSLMVSDTATVISLVLLTYISSWFLIHTAFTLHYAHVYYQEYEKTKQPPLIFPDTIHPNYIDFLYFSMLIGMTCQTADVSIAHSRTRSLAMIQGFTAFVFNTTLLVLTINLIYDLPNR
jgi:uncharacterized membrane protein